MCSGLVASHIAVPDRFCILLPCLLLLGLSQGNDTEGADVAGAADAAEPAAAAVAAGAAADAAGPGRPGKRKKKGRKNQQLLQQDLQTLD